MTSPDYSNHFSLANIPFGIASSPRHLTPQCVTRLENTVVFLGALQQSGAFVKISGLPVGVFSKSTLNEFAALPKAVHREVRTVLQNILIKELPSSSTEDISAVILHLPVSVGGFTDFSCSLHHVRNAGRAILNDESPPPGFFNFPIGYNGRSSTVVVSGTPIVRPKGHFFDRTATSEKKPIIYGPCRAMDYELEVGVIVGKGVPKQQGVDAKDADEHIFGMVILNDWSARDIQGCEMVPLGPLNGKAFGTSISPWVVTLDALESFKASGPKPEAVLASHLEDVSGSESNYDIGMKVELLNEGQITTLSESNTRDLHWSGRQMCAHLASTGADLQTGDILGTGTVSGPTDGSFGCLLEVTKGGKEPVFLANGSKRFYLQDGDVIRMTALAGAPGSGVGFGECVGELRPAT
ncbi:uncharacterized protein N7446_009092 [Penicillium canescens]|uniref:Fumarylacetoacetase n=1 Tax=Penicillium canescens TaxID=5083 RepID=A0AAD6N5T5_PENCN|nr:uncharacterized protein N7446_009092 [Penicillium canescens]KAJ6034343.1 hypothetical protein N7460_008518 [Penicillium canescens]KAJ6046005.1 hypothetical protein N7444_007259 [Penicillium canescens]KAJ6053080.1 hypothetical protein N7446_009092 [Penicillium canescens]